MAQSTTPQITARRINFEFPQQIERYWFANSPFKTHLLNSLTLLLPDAEQYIMRNVGRQLKQINNPQLKQKVRAFVSQEGQHSSQHPKFWDNLHLQGYIIEPYIRFVRAIFLNILERRLSFKLKREDRRQETEVNWMGIQKGVSEGEASPSEPPPPPCL